jgi:hypothetical protein
MEEINIIHKEIKFREITESKQISLCIILGETVTHAHYYLYHLHSIANSYEYYLAVINIIIITTEVSLHLRLVMT